MLNPKLLKIILLIGLIVLIAGMAVFIVQNIKKKEVEERSGLEKNIAEETIVSKPWIEVVSPKVIKKDGGTGEILVELRTGDELKQGDIIETDKQGLAVIHFPNSSVVRLEKNGSLVIEESSFNEETGSLKVRIKLKLGRAWSRIMQLVGADSFWEVKTSNVVATVRGTAFGIEHSEKKSSIFVDEGKVEVEGFDFKANKKIEGTKTILEKNKMIEIKKEKIEELKIKPIELIVKEVSKEVLEEEWIKRNKEADARLLEKIETLKEEGLKEREIEKEIKKEFIEEAEKIIEPKKDELLKPIESKKIEKEIESTIKELPEIEFPKESSEEENPREAKEPDLKPKSLEIIMPKSITNLTEDDFLNLKAMLTMTDGSKKDITKECAWRVLGGIGIMEAPGLFRAKLDISISELGQAPGQIICTYIDSKTKEAFLASTPTINVKDKIETEFEIREQY